MQSSSQEREDDDLMFRGGAIELGLNTYWGLLTAIGQHAKMGLSPDEMMSKIVTNLGDLDALATRSY